MTIPRGEDNLEIIDTGYDHFASVNKGQYSMGGEDASKGNNERSDIIFSEEMGLAIERPPNGVTIEQLWRIV